MEVGLVEDMDHGDAFGAIGGIGGVAGDIRRFDVKNKIGRRQGVLPGGVHLI